MKNGFKKTIAFLSASLLVNGSVLASDGEQDYSFLKRSKEEPVAAVVNPAPIKVVEVVPARDKYFAMEATYNFNHYRPSFTDMSTTSKKFENSGSFGLGVGMFVNKNFRSDLMLSYTLPTTYKFSSNANNYNSRVTTTKLMLNGTYDVNPVVGKVSPYISAGIGAACNHTSTKVNLNGSNTNVSGNYIKFAYQAGAGLAYITESQNIVDLGYRFADNGPNKKIAGVSNKRLQSHEILLGMKIPF